MKALRTLFLSELAEMHDAETRVAKSLPKAIKAATCQQLRQVLADHLEESADQVENLSRVFACFEEKPQSKKCSAMAGMLDGGELVLAENKKSPALNAAIIASWQKVEHYEIAVYGTLRTWAEILENDEAANILEQMLDEAKEADGALNDLAEEKNQEALAEVEAGVASAD